MTRIYRAFLLSAVLFSAPQLAESALAAQTTQTTAGPAAPRAAGETAPAQPYQRVSPNVEPTPMPMSLPDPARAAEIQHEYGFGIATLIAGALLVILSIYALVYFAMRRSWSTAH
jgi:hypothetical protein